MTFSPNRFLLFDGAMGTQLQERGLQAGALPELLCLTDPDVVTEVHAAYVAAGADIVGGCCGTSPDYIRCLAQAIRG